MKLGDNSINTVLHQITRGILNDHCPAGINCMGKPITDTIDKVLQILATRAGKSDDIDYKSVEKSDNRKEKFKVKQDDNIYKLDEEYKNNGNDDKQPNTNENGKMKLKLNDSIFKQNEEKVGSDDKEIDKINMDPFKVKLYNSNFQPEDKRNINEQDKTKKQDDKETNKHDNGNMTQMRIHHLNPIKNFKAANENEMKKNIDETGSMTNDIEYYLLGSNTIIVLR